MRMSNKNTLSQEKVDLFIEAMMKDGLRELTQVPSSIIITLTPAEYYVVEDKLKEIREKGVS